VPTLHSNSMVRISEFGRSVVMVPSASWLVGRSVISTLRLNGVED
jgi:hypothetical protein